MKIPEEVEAWIATLGIPKMRENAAADMRPLIDLLPDRARVAEIGVFSGECSAAFLMDKKVAYILCVDNWEGSRNPGDKTHGVDMGIVRNAFFERMDAAEVSARGGNYSVFNGDSTLAAKYYDGIPFDLAYIDADHAYESVKADIAGWKLALKRGGILAGHDYSNTDHPGVKRAVDELLGVPNILPDSSWWMRI